jgi:diacylglycerol O-acyltransferase
MWGERIKLSALDASFLASESANAPMHTGALLLLDGSVSLAQIASAIGPGLSRMSRLTSRLEGAAVKAEAALEPDSSFDLGHHLHQIAVLPPYKTQQVAEAAAQAFAKALRRYRPLWEMALLGGQDTGRAVLGKLHHCVADGIAGVDVLEGFFGDRNELAPSTASKDRDLVEAKKTQSLLSSGAGLAGLTLDRLVQWVARPRAARQEIMDVMKGVATMAADVLDLAPRLPFNGRLSNSRRIGWFEIDRTTLGAIKRRFGCTANDALLAIVSGGVRAYLRALGYPIGEKSLRVLLPVSMRRHRGGPRVGNQVSLMVAPLPIAIASASGRLHAIMRMTDELRGSGQARMLARVNDAVTSVAPGLLPILGSIVCNRAVNLICSNVPGPRALLEVAGRRVETLVPLVPIPDGIGLAFGAMTYAGRLCLGITADAGLVEDLQPLLTGLRQSHAQLRRAAGIGSKAAA